MNDHDLEIARMIAVNSGDIPVTIDRLCDEVERLRAEALLPGDLLDTFDYPALAMRTAAGPEVFHRERLEDISARTKWGAAASIADALADFVHSAQVLDSIKATLFYGKDYNPPRREEADKLIANFHYDSFENLQLFHAILGVCSESGELLEDVLNLVAVSGTSDGSGSATRDLNILRKAELVLNMRREIGDIDWFQELFAVALGKFTVQDAREVNIDRLRKRFPDKFTETDAIARADEASAIPRFTPSELRAHVARHGSARPDEGVVLCPITIVSGPQGSGKTFHSQALARHFGAERIIDEWDGKMDLYPGDLALTLLDPRSWKYPPKTYSHIPIVDALQDLIAVGAIPKPVTDATARVDEPLPVARVVGKHPSIGAPYGSRGDPSPSDVEGS